MKRLLFVLCAGLMACAFTARAELKWGTDLNTALAQAKKDKKLVMINFTGSDWCIWCKRLQKDVFSTKEFDDYAKDNLVLVEADFPRTKKIDSKQQKANEALMTKYNVQGFPTLVVLNGDGKKVGELGYEKTPQLFISKLQDAKKK